MFSWEPRSGYDDGPADADAGPGTRTAMHLALSALKDGHASVAELADRLGYRSEAAFSRAFKRPIGVPPGAARQRA